MAAKKPRRTKGDGALFQRSNGLWVGRVELPSIGEKRRYRTVSSMDRNDCINKLKKLRGEILEGKITATGNTTVSKWLDKWLAIKHNKLRPGTWNDYERTVRLHIKPAIGRKRLSALEPDHIRQMHDAIPYPRTAQVAHVVMEGALKTAVDEGIIPRNVAKIAQMPEHTPQVRDPLTADQARKLLKSAIDSGDPMAARWAAAFLLGARPGEILGLQWDRLDLVNGVAEFSWQLQQLEQSHGCGDPTDEKGKPVYPCKKKRVSTCPQAYWDLPRSFEHKILHGSLALTRPKTKAGIRVVPLPLPLWYLLEKLPRPTDNPHNLVWHLPKGVRGAPAGRPISPRDDHHNWTNALRAAGLPHAAPYVTRHTTATLLMQAGVPEDIRMAILGHVSIAATRGYAHIDQTMTRQAMTALDQLLELS